MTVWLSNHWDSPADIIESAALSYRIDLWREQEFYIEVWCEKDAVIGIVEQAANEYDVSCFSCRGYGSTTGYWNAAQRIHEINKSCIIFHLGDHDPSGVDMTRDRPALVTAGGVVARYPSSHEYNFTLPLSISAVMLPCPSYR